MKAKAVASVLGLVTVAGAGLWWAQRDESTYSIHGVYAAGDGDVIVAYFRDDGGERRTTHVARRSPLDEKTKWELDLTNGMVVSPRSVLQREGTVVVADRPESALWRVRGVEPETGSVRWSRDVRGREDYWPKLFGAEDHVFVVDGVPRLQILSAASGEIEFEYDFEMIGPPNFNDRWLLLSNRDDGVSFVDLTTMSLTPQLPQMGGGALCLVGDAAYGLTLVGTRPAAVVRVELESGSVTRFEASDDDASWPVAGTSCGWMETDRGLRLVIRNLANHLVAIDLDPKAPTSGARTAFEMTFGGDGLALDHGDAPKDAARPLRGALTRFAPVELVRQAQREPVLTYGVVDLDKGVVIHEGSPFPDSTVADLEWVRDPRDGTRVLISATWFAPGNERQGHVGVFDGATGALVLDLEHPNVETHSAAVGPHHLWLWASDGFSPSLPIFAYDASTQRVVGGPNSAEAPVASKGLEAVFGL